MTENTEESKEVKVEEAKSQVAMLPPTDDRPIAIVGMEGITEYVTKLSKQLTDIGMTHVVLTMEDAEKEGLTREDLLEAQLSQSATDGLDEPLSSKLGGGTHKNGHLQPKKKKRKKGKKTHRKK